MASSSSSGAGGVLSDSDEGAAAMAECVGLLFGRWTALQLAVGRPRLAGQGRPGSPPPSSPGSPATTPEVTKHLIIMYTRCLRQNHSYIDKLRKTRLAGSAITQSKEVLRGNDSSSDDESPSSEEDNNGAGPMEVEAPALRNPKPPKPVPGADGWTTVPSRRRSK